MKNGIEIRKANEADFMGLAGLVAEKDFGYPTDAELLRKRLIDLLSSGDLILVAVYGIELVGMILLHQTRFLHRPPDGRIVSLVVAEKFRSEGIGALLIEEAEKNFKFWECGRIEVSSGIKREAAHRFYLREGFSEAPRRFIKIITKEN
jgi:GNAT superfamily N-acetyltransferase